MLMEAFEAEEKVPSYWRRNLSAFRLMASNFVSFFGDQIYIIALPLIVLAMTGSPLQMGIVAALERGAVFLQPLAGVAADRYNRKHILLWCDGGRFLVMGAMGVYVIASGETIGYMYAGAFLIGLFTQFYQTAQFATIPGLVSKGDLPSINSFNTSIFQLSVFVAPAIGGVIVSLYHPGIALVINSFTFLIGLLLIWSVPFHARSSASKSKPNVMGEIVDGFKVVYRIKPIFYTNIAMLFSVFGTTLFLTMLIVHLKTALMFSPSEIGMLLGIGGAGAILGSLFLNIVKQRIPSGWLLTIGGIVGGLSIVMFGFGHSFWFLALMNAIGTFTAGLMSPCIVTIRQKLTPEKWLGRVQATSRWMTWILMPVAALVSGMIGEWSGTGITIIIGGIISTCASILYLHPSLRTFL
ncbi:MFS transporter [Halobacillus fulvus]|nr:MFS transporter [Halobacillus fulvus]